MTDMTVHRSEEVGQIAFDHWASFTVRELVLHSPLADKIAMAERDSITGRQVIEFAVRITAPPVTAWSSGEKALWAFLVSLAGVCEVNLMDVRNHYAGDNPTRPWLMACFAAMLGDGR
jgi:hypothetical protein